MNEHSEREKFLAGIRKIVSVPKTEVLRREREDKEARKRARERKAKGFVNIGFVLVLAVGLSALPTVAFELHQELGDFLYHLEETLPVYSDGTTSPMYRHTTAVNNLITAYRIPDSGLDVLSPTGYQNGETISGDGSKAKQMRSVPHWLEWIFLIGGAIISGTLGKRAWEALRLVCCP